MILRVILNNALLNIVNQHFTKMTRYQYYFCYRNLVKPIAVQSKEKEDRYVDTYKVIWITFASGLFPVYKLYGGFNFFKVYRWGKENHNFSILCL